MPQEYKPVPEIQTVTPPLAFKDRGDRTRFNERAESNLADMAKLAEDWNTKVLPPLNIVGEMANEILPSLPEVIGVGKNIGPILAVTPHVDAIDAVATDIAKVNTVAADIADVRITSRNIAAVNTAAENMDAVSTVAANIDVVLTVPTAAATALNAANKATASANAAVGSADAAAAAQAVCEGVEGNLTGGATAEAVPGSVMKRDSDGNTKVAATPTDAAHAASKEYVDTSSATVAASVAVLSETIAPTLAKVDAGIFFSGQITPYHGSMDETGVHPLVDGAARTDWHLCDGTSGTPDLRAKFILGAGGAYPPGASGGAESAATSSDGGHTHTGGAIGATTLTVAQMPAHTHSLNASSSASAASGSGANVPRYSSTSTGSTGGGGSHTHTNAATGSAGSHGHTVATLPPYYALCFIMKL